MELVKEVFKDDYAKLKQSDEKLALAGKLMQQALKSLDDPTGKYVMLREALRLAIDAGDPNAVEQSATALTSVYDLDEFDTLADSWDDLLDKTRPAGVNKAVAEVGTGRRSIGRSPPKSSSKRPGWARSRWKPPARAKTTPWSSK